MTLEDDNLATGTELNGTPVPEEAGNRTFLIAAGVLGGIALLALIFIAVYAAVLLPKSRAQQVGLVATRSIQNTQMAMIITQTSAAAAASTSTATPVPPTATPLPTATPVVKLPTNTPPGPQVDPRTATVAALLTQAANTTQTVAPTINAGTIGRVGGTPAMTELPKTGFAEDVGLPTMLGAAGLLLLVIFLARRLRAA
ncbi:MAG TPA: LPXTG cell wall anchor domain-containing protein [Anaerolineales bacterium]